MYSPDDLVLVAILVVPSLLVWWRQILRLIAGFVLVLVVVGLGTVLSAMQYFS